MRLVVIESPYAGDVEANVAYARRAMADSLARGEAPIASHLLYTQPGILNDADENERAKGIDCGLEWAKKADRIAFYLDLGWSPGMMMARSVCAARGATMEFRYLDAKTEEVRHRL